MATQPAKSRRVETLNYCTGGFHPVHLDDQFKNGRYTVIHKLGHGGFATVWLARDAIRSRYVALKILAAGLSRDCPEVEILRRLRSSNGSGHVGKAYVMSMLDHFWIYGPNGEHLCVVSQVGGPSIKQWNESPGLRSGTRRLKENLARKVCLEATEGLAFIHSTGTVHGDFTSANILLQLANIDEWTIDEIHERLGEPTTQDLHQTAGRLGESPAPKYTVNAISMEEVDPKWLSDQVIIIDFGIAFLQEHSSPDIGTPKGYCAPEFLFDAARSVSSDIWALGCTIYEIRTGSSLFKYRGVPTRDKMLSSMVSLLGTLPQVWWDKWEEGREWYAIETNDGGELVDVLEGTLHNQIMEIGLHDGVAAVPPPPKEESPKQGGSSNESGKKASSSSKSLDSTNKLLALVEELTTSEADEVMELVNRPSGNKSNSSSSNHKKESGSGSGKSAEKSASSEGKSVDKSISSEGLSTGKEAEAVERAENLIGTEGTGGSAEDATATANVKNFLESEGTMITVIEANGLENLLRKALRFLPEQRLAPSELAKHHWFFDEYPVVTIQEVVA